MNVVSRVKMLLARLSKRDRDVVLRAMLRCPRGYAACPFIRVPRPKGPLPKDQCDIFGGLDCEKRNG